VPAPPPKDVVDREALAGAAFSAVRWTGVARLAGEVVSLVAMVVLARLLTPADFGAAAVALVAATVATATGQQGLTAPLVQRGALDAEHLRAAMLLSLVLGIGLATLAATVAEPLAEPLFGSDIADLLPLTAPFFLLAAIAAVSQARIERELGFRRLGLVHAARSIVGSVACVALALAGLGAEALVLGTLAGVVLATALLVRAAPPPWPAWDRRAGGEILRFGLPSLGSGLASIGSRHIDYAVVAARLPAAAVGIYWRAYTLGVDYQGKLSGLLAQIALPLYARAPDLATQQAMRERIVRLQTLILFPLLGGLILLAPVAVPLVFGEQWDDAIVPTQILAVAGMMGAIQAGTAPLLLAVGRPGALLRWNLFKIVTLGTIVYVVAPEGLVALAIAVTVYDILRSLVGQQILLRRHAGIDVKALWKACIPAIAGTAVMLPAGWALLEAGDALGVPSAVANAVTALAAPAVYLAVLRFAFAPALTDLRTVRDRLIPALARRPALRPDPSAAGYTGTRPGA
jgi:lipopolysaccharide exporter